MRRILLSLAPSALTGIIALLLWLNDAWQRVGVPLGERNFGDLHVITLAATCAQGNPAWRAADPPCIDGIAHYNYPSLWAQFFGLLGADGSWTEPVAAILIVAFLIALIPITWLAIGASASIPRTSVVAIAALTPPVWLSFQRGNTDLAAFAIVIAATMLWLRGQRTASGIAIGIAATLKVFPIGAALLLIQRQRFSRAAVIACITTGAIGLALIAPDLPIIAQRTPQIDGASFGVALLPLLQAKILNIALGMPAARIIGFLLLLAVTSVIAMLLRSRRHATFVRGWRALLTDVASDAPSQALVLAGGGAFLMAYLLGPSYDYRLIFLIPVIAGLLRINRKASKVAGALLITIMILSYSTVVGSAEYIADGLLLLLVPCMIISAWILIRQPANESVKEVVA